MSFKLSKLHDLQILSIYKKIRKMTFLDTFMVDALDIGAINGTTTLLALKGLDNEHEAFYDRWHCFLQW